jgi:hypothetical protein
MMPTDEELLARAVRNSQLPRDAAMGPRWRAVMNTFVLGSTYAQELCHRFGIDPDETLRRR